MRRLAALVLPSAVLLACADTSAAPSQGGVERRPPNASGQKPAFPEQTRAPAAPANVRFTVKTFAKSLDHPWSLAFLPDGRMLVTERPGRLRFVAKDGSLSPAVSGVPAVDAQGQGGLFDVVLDPAYAQNRTIYLAYAEKRDGDTNGTAVARAVLDGNALRDVKVIWRMTPNLDSSAHFGGRMVFAKDGTLFITTGERSIHRGRVQAQRLDGTLGKVVRIKPDGSIPDDNPLVGRAGARPEIYSYGHRNLQAAALHPRTGALWVVDHGARGGDEINVVQAGRDYGWPTITYGIEYAGGAIGSGITQKAGMEQPRYYWDPSIAPSGMAFYDADLFPQWKGSLFVGALAGQHLARLVLDGDKIVGEERLLDDRARIRDVRVGPDGAVYVLTDERDGEILVLTPAR
jgi:glucose/arabinose dehydrogenase